MVDAAGTTAYAYTVAGQLWTGDLPSPRPRFGRQAARVPRYSFGAGGFASDTVTNFFRYQMRTNLALAQPVGKWTNGFWYDPAKRLTNVTSQAGTFAYTLGGAGGASPLVKKLLLPNTAYVTNTFDTVARLTGTYLKNSGNTVLDSYVYAYDPANERTNLTRADASTVAYSYDNIGQLTIANSSVNTEDRGYTYDAGWNLRYRTNNGVSTAFLVDNKNELTKDGTVTNFFDSNGNLVATGSGTNALYRYDDENRLINWFHFASGLATTNTGDLRTDFTYDGLGRLRKRVEYSWSGGGGGAPPPGPPPPVGASWAESGETHYIYDGNRVIQERDTNNTPTVAYTRGSDLSGTLEGAGGIGGLLARSSGYSGSTGNWSTHNTYFADGNGNVTYMLNSSQSVVASYRYDPFGNTISSSGTLAAGNVYRFSSKEIHGNSGMYYYLYRFYDPNLQRWINPDPLGEGGGLNLFVVNGNDPVDVVDAWGLVPDMPTAHGWCGKICPCTVTCIEAATFVKGTSIPVIGRRVRRGADYKCTDCNGNTWQETIQNTAYLTRLGRLGSLRARPVPPSYTYTIYVPCGD